MNSNTFHDVKGTDTDDKAYLLEARSLAILRLAPILLIMVALLVGVLSLWLDDGDTLIRLSEMVITGALGSLTTPQLVKNNRTRRGVIDVGSEPTFTRASR